MEWESPSGRREVLIITAGTSDMSVAEEARATAQILGNTVTTMYDVGVAGLHRLLDRHRDLESAHVLIVIAGMDGALPSVVGGLVSQPVWRCRPAVAMAPISAAFRLCWRC